MTTIRDMIEEGHSNCCGANVAMGFCLDCKEHCGIEYTVIYTAHDNEEYQEEFTDLKKAKKYAKGLEERGFKNVSIN